MKGAEIITEYLIRERVPYVVGLCGHGDLGLLDALYDRRAEIRTLSVHHESAAGFIADAYYRIRHQPLATFTSVGPGSANLPVALGSALMDSSAFLAITGNVPTSQFNRAPFQETGRHYQADTPGVLRPYVKRSFQATRAGAAAADAAPGVRGHARRPPRPGAPGRAARRVRGDALASRCPTPGCGGTASRAGRPRPPPTWRHPGVAARRGSAADRGRVRGAERRGSRELDTFAAAAGIPVVTSPLGKGAADPQSPLHLGATGRNGSYQANRAARSADLILAFGTRFDDRFTSSWLPGYTYSIPPARLIQVDVDPAELGRNYPVTLGVAANPKDVLGQLRAALTDPPDTARWLGEIAGWARDWEQHTAAGRTADVTPLRPQRVLADLRAVLPPDGILLSDVGAHHNWIVQEWPPGGPGTLLQSWGFASMCFGLAGVLGARLAAPDTPAVAVVGDGGFLMLPSVVATAVQYGIPAVWLVWNNGGLHLHPRPAARLLRRGPRAGHHVPVRGHRRAVLGGLRGAWPARWAPRDCACRPRVIWARR